VARGAYVLAEDAEAQVSLFASGSEVHIALEAKARLGAAGRRARVVSVPCFELFAEQADDYRVQVLGSARVRVGIEAAVRQGWDALIGADGAFVGMTGFGASAPYKDLYAHFGITAERVAEAALEALARNR
jgi:transketolase